MIRCYDGCWDSETQARMDATEQELRAVRQVEPEAHVAYFPVEGLYVVHVWGRDLSGFHENRADAVKDALARIKESK